MKKVTLFSVIMLCLLLTGCSNAFAEQEYDSAEKISQIEDRYAKEVSVFNVIDGGYSLTVSKFDGRETLWSDTLEASQNIEIDFSLSISEGQVKIVHIDAEGNVSTVLECSPETVTDGFVTKTVALSGGQNRLKIVGYDCEDVDLKMLFREKINQASTEPTFCIVEGYNFTLENQEKRIENPTMEDLTDFLNCLFEEEDQFITLTLPEAKNNIRYVQACFVGTNLLVQLGVEEQNETKLVEKTNLTNEECVEIFTQFYNEGTVENQEEYQPVQF